MHLLPRLTIWALLGLLTSATLKEHIDRTNWGAHFVRVGNLLSGETKFRHTFRIKPYKGSFQEISKIDCNSLGFALERHCETIGRLTDRLNEMGRKEDSDAVRRVQDALASIPNIDDASLHDIDGRKVWDPSKSRRKRSVVLGPKYCSQLKRDNYESDGTADGIGLITTVGKFMASSMGISTKDDVRNVDAQICAIQEENQLLTDQVQASEGRMASYSNCFNNRIDAVQDGMINMENRITETETNLQKLAKKEYSDLEKLHGDLEREQEAIEILLQVNTHALEYLDRLSYLQSETDRFVAGIDVLMSGRLSENLVPVSDVAKVIDHIRSRQLHSLSLLHPDPAFYYQLYSITFTKSDSMESLFVTLNIPLYTNGGLMTVYRVDRTNLLVPNNTKMSTYIHNLPDFLAVSEKQQYFIELSNAEYAACQGNVIKVCPTQKSLQDFNQLTCASALYLDNAQEIKNKCDVRVDNQHQPSSVVKIGYDRFLIHSNRKHAEGATWTVTCPWLDGLEEQRPACSECYFKLPCGCKLIGTNEFLVQEQLQDCMDFGIFDFTKKLGKHQSIATVTHGVNLHFLHALFRPERLHGIYGNTQKESPWSFEIPNFKIHTYNFNDSVAIADKYRIDMRKLINESARAGKLFLSKTDSAYHLVSKLHTRTVNHLEIMEKELMNIKRNGLTKMSFTVSTAVLVLLIIISIGLGCTSLCCLIKAHTRVIF